MLRFFFCEDKLRFLSLSRGYPCSSIAAPLGDAPPLTARRQVLLHPEHERHRGLRRRRRLHPRRRFRHHRRTHRQVKSVKIAPQLFGGEGGGGGMIAIPFCTAKYIVVKDTTLWRASAVMRSCTHKGEGLHTVCMELYLSSFVLFCLVLVQHTRLWRGFRWAGFSLVLRVLLLLFLVTAAERRHTHCRIPAWFLFL